MNIFWFNISRLWNRFPFLLISLARHMIWDYTGANQDLLRPADFGQSAKDILTPTVAWRQR